MREFKLFVVDKTKQNTVLSMAGMWETNSRVNRSARSLVRYGLDDGYWNSYSKSVKDLTLNDVHSVAKKTVQPNSLGWLIVGDKAKVMEGLKGLNMEVIEITTDGEVVKKAKP